MSLPTHPAPSQAIRCGDRAHKASIARQRAHSTYNPTETANALIQIIRHRLDCGQPLEAAYFAGLQDDVWAILCDRLSSDELREVNLAAAGGVGVYDPVDVQTPELASHHTPSWHDHEPTIVHSLKWHDADGIEHLHVIRADDLDEALRHILKVKLCIKAAKLKAQNASEADHSQATDARPDWCRVHDCAMKQRGDESKVYWYSHKATDGKWCRGKA